MSQPHEPIAPSRPSRPRWVYLIGALVLAVFVAAVIFAVAIRAEEEPIEDPAPTDIADPRRP